VDALMPCLDTTITMPCYAVKTMAILICLVCISILLSSHKNSLSQLRHDGGKKMNSESCIPSFERESFLQDCSSYPFRSSKPQNEIIVPSPCSFF
jgi:hypothetical protein